MLTPFLPPPSTSKYHPPTQRPVQSYSQPNHVSLLLSFFDHHDNCCTKNNSKTTKIEQDQGSGDLGDAAELVASRTKKQGTLFGHRTATVPLSVDDVGKSIVTMLQCCNVAMLQCFKCCNVAMLQIRQQCTNVYSNPTFLFSVFSLCNSAPSEHPVVFQNVLGNGVQKPAVGGGHQFVAALRQQRQQ
jgi:hypothetical protein